MMNVTVQMVVYCVILVLLAIPLGRYMGKVMNGEHVFLSGVLQPVERVIYRVLKIDPDEDMDWKKYSVCAALFSVLFQPDAGTEFPELRVSRNRYCGPVCPDQGLCEGKENRYRKLLCGYDKDGPLHTDSSVNGCIPCHCITGSAPDV